MARQIQRVPGTRDFYPEEMRLRSWLFDKMRNVAQRYGYEEYDGPFLEAFELYEAKSGEQLVAEEMYTLVDRGGRRLGIRPEMTPTLARMVAQRQRELRKPIKWFSIPAVWRYERPQKGRVREHWQWNVDLFGVPEVEAEAEVIAVFATLLREVGLTEREFRVRIGHRGWLAGELSRIGVAPESHVPVLRAIDRREKVGEEVFRVLLGGAGLSASQGASLAALLDARDYGDFAPLSELFDLLDCYGLADYCEFDPGIVRGLAYYTSTVYEIWDARREFRAIAGGGRYDDMTVALGGDPIPCAGMAMGVVVLTLLLDRERKLPSLRRQTETFVAVHPSADRREAITVTEKLREAGMRVDRALQAATLGRQLRHAEAIGARVAVIVAPDESAQGEMIVRDLRAGTQTSIPADDVVVAAKRLLAMRDSS
jgi:histidyl-tRNA synthetase